jgi:hypothetical protein
MFLSTYIWVDVVVYRKLFTLFLLLIRDVPTVKCQLIKHLSHQTKVYYLILITFTTHLHKVN